MKQKGISKLGSEEIKMVKANLGNVFEIYGKGDPNVKEEGLRILEGWGRIMFIVSNDGKRIGLELTERWERERVTD
jgi:hypothetical protein